MKSQVLHTVRSYIPGEAAGEIEIDHSWEWKAHRMDFQADGKAGWVQDSALIGMTML